VTLHRGFVETARLMVSTPARERLPLGGLFVIFTHRSRHIMLQLLVFAFQIIWGK
jgi:hypothetical protein